MLFWRLEHPDTWWCDFNTTFKKIEEENKTLKREDEEKRTEELKAIDVYRKKIGEKSEESLTEDKDELVQVKKECREIVQYIHYEVDPSIEYFMEKNGVAIDDDVKYCSWSESAKLILKLRKEMIDEGMQKAESTISDYFEEKKANDKYEKWIWEEEEKMIKSFKFTRIMNLYMKHNEYMDKKHNYMYEDEYLPIAERKRKVLYYREIQRLKKKFMKERRALRWKKGIIGAKKINWKKIKRKYVIQRSIYRHQFCQDNKFIFSKKILEVFKEKRNSLVSRWEKNTI
jgi:hypothetical protein